MIDPLRLLCVLLVAGICGHPRLAAGQGPSAGEAGFTSAQIGQILQHGPWPTEWRPDPSNRVSGRNDAADFGRSLFFDAGLSPTGRVSCSSCHRPERGWTDGRPRGIGLREGARNTPGLADVRLNRWFGWSGAGDSLWAQSLRPILDANEMGSSASHVKQMLGSHKELSGAYAAVFGRTVAMTDADDVIVDAAKALAAYQETIVSARTAFDDFRDALAAGDRGAQARYPATARRGLALFVGEAGCSTCHGGPAFSDGRFHATGGKPATKSADHGRTDGIARLLESPYTLAGRFNDDPDRRSHWHADEMVSNASRGAFRTPPLRYAARTAPYLHDGSRPSLRAVLRDHPAGGRRLNERDRTALEAFLRTLSTAASGG